MVFRSYCFHAMKSDNYMFLILTFQIFRIEMVRTCAAPGCRTGYPLKKGEANQVRPKRALFAAPKDQELLKKWQHNLPRKEFCELHFLQEDIQNSYFGLCNGVPSDIMHCRPLTNI